MLTAEYLDRLPDDIVSLYADLEISILEDVVRRTYNMNYLSATSIWQLEQAREAGFVYQNAIIQIAKITGQSEELVTEAFESSSIKSLRFDDKIYTSAGLTVVPLAQSQSMLNVLEANILKTNGDLSNLTQTTALKAQQLFIKHTSIAQLQVQSGAFSYDQAIKMATKEISKEGLRVVYPSGEERTIESAVRSNILTGVNKSTLALSEMRAEQTGAKYIETSAHIGARDTGEGPANHEGWQGKKFLKVGSSRKYQNFYTATGYGTPEGLGGPNCRHSFFGLPEGAPSALTEEMRKSLEKPDVSYKGKTYSYYEATQKQRYHERKIREWKLEAHLMEVAKQDASFANNKVRQWQSEARAFTKATNVRRDYTRERIASQ